MGERALELKDSDLDKIGEYVKSRITEWIDSDIFKNRPGRSRELDLLERMIRVEEELKSQRELIKLGFEQIDKKFNRITGLLALGFTVLSLLIAFLK